MKIRITYSKLHVGGNLLAVGTIIEIDKARKDRYVPHYAEVVEDGELKQENPPVEKKLVEENNKKLQYPHNKKSKRRK